MFPVIVDEVPGAEHGVEILLVAGCAIMIEIGLETRDQVAMRILQGILPNHLSVARRQLVDPPVHHIVFLGHLQIFRLADGREIRSGAGNVALMAVGGMVDQLGQHVPVIEPVGVSAEQTISLRVAGDGRFDEAMGEPRATVVWLLAARRVGRIRKNVAVGFTASFNAVDHLVEPLAQFRMFDPAQRVAGAHEKASCAAARRSVSQNLSCG